METGSYLHGKKTPNYVRNSIFLTFMHSILLFTFAFKVDYCLKTRQLFIKLPLVAELKWNLSK
jgi:hypothetical protein